MLKIQFIPCKVRNNVYYSKVLLTINGSILISTYNWESKKCTINGYGKKFNDRIYNQHAAFGDAFYTFNEKTPSLLKDIDKEAINGLYNSLKGIETNRTFSVLLCVKEFTPEDNTTLTNFYNCIVKHLIEKEPSINKETKYDDEENKPGIKKFILIDDTGFSELIAGNFYNVIDCQENYVSILNEKGEKKVLNKNRGKIITIT